MGRVPYADENSPEVKALGKWRESKAFSDAQRAMLASTDAMTREIRVADEVFEALRPHFSSRERVELTATIAGYNLVSCFLEALHVDPEAAHAQTGRSLK